MLITSKDKLNYLNKRCFLDSHLVYYFSVAPRFYIDIISLTKGVISGRKNAL